ncbi:response regulator [Lysobacter koreensis]|uniref:Response regulator n=1 Tax=Lysobacter koreensis TaxID=266122 RepID=A0ABW2YRZ8_9GAMM
MSQPAPGFGSTRARILIVEDEACLAMMLEDLLRDAGNEVLKAARVHTALELVESQRFDAAILDINIAGKPVFPVADALRQRDVPLMFTSGYGYKGLPDEYSAHPILQKPYGLEQLQQALLALLRG